MKTIPLTASFEIVVAGKGSNSREREQPAAEEFSSALSLHKAEGEPKSKTDLLSTQHERRATEDAASMNDLGFRNDDGFLRSDGRFLHRLKAMTLPSQIDKPDGAQNEPRSDGSTQSVDGGHSVVEVEAMASEAIMMTQIPLGPAASGSRTSEVRDETGTRRAEHSRGIVETHAKPAAIEPRFDAKNTVQEVAVTVHEQQTHFTQERVGRSGLLAKSDPPNGAAAASPAVAAHNVQAIPFATETQRVGTKLSETAQIGPIEGEPDIGQMPDDSTNAPHPATQILSKILDAGNDDTTTGQTSPSTATWQSSERPFGSLMRLLRIELSPASLGTVHVTLKGVNAALSISIEAERSQTAASLGADRAILSDRLKEAGFAIDDLIIKSADRPVDVASPSRADQTPGAASNALASGADDPQRRQSGDHGRRSRVAHEQNPQFGSHGSEHENAMQGQDPRIPPPTAWRGRYATRSV
ncbi:MAG: flagellar hook-length control protein FliK [Hyphomicrobiaceae bacterium]|uniref:flagellar hook-length control protein FliK n=1 Tax=Pseudorhodoplanes sp. TaxID=1934341 RepID=UPI003D0A0AC3